MLPWTIFPDLYRALPSSLRAVAAAFVSNSSAGEDISVSQLALVVDIRQLEMGFGLYDTTTGVSMP